MKVNSRGREPIAVIGMSGRFPGASDTDELWRVLKRGRCCVTEVPSERQWHVNGYFDPRPQTMGKTYAKWGGFLDEIDRFDPVFFGITPRDAATMGPCERIFVEEAWRAIEDAGYSPGDLRGANWGVFACAKGDHAVTLSQHIPFYFTETDSFGSARLSYLLDLKGPAMSIDTACSSTASAIAYACDSLNLDNCDTAIVGGGGVYENLNVFVMNSQVMLFSPDGLCRAFDASANGTVLGEAVGVVILKKLSRALVERDNIYGVIRGWGTNHDGKTNGITAPSVKSQIRLQAEVYRKFDVNPGHISLVEAHGTGTKLGDPIEFQALSESFRGFTDAKGYCALGTLKPNLGHAFFGAGISALIKTMLCIKHREIPPSVNYQEPNPGISLDDSPFYITKRGERWTPGADGVLRAAINSSGASGINAHLVVEELTEPLRDSKRSITKRPRIFPISAKQTDSLEAYASILRDHVTENTREEAGTNGYLAHLSFTLRRRRPMRERVAIVAESEKELLARLDDIAAGHYDTLTHGSVRESAKGTGGANSTVDDSDAIEGAPLETLAQRWVKGGMARLVNEQNEEVDQQIRIPTYRFAKRQIDVAELLGDINKDEPRADHLHPLVHVNRSDRYGLRFSSRFDGEEFFLRDHRIQGNRVLPGVAYLETARAAAAMALQCDVVSLRSVVWITPFVFGEHNKEIQIEFRPSPESDAACQSGRFEIYSAATNGERVTHCQGIAEDQPRTGSGEILDLAKIRQRVQRHVLGGTELYAMMKEWGFALGPGHQGVVELHVGDREALTRLQKPKASHGGFVLDPAMLDSSLHGATGVAVDADSGNAGQPLPFSLESLTVRRPCVEKMWAWVRPSRDARPNQTDKLDYDLFDASGGVCISMRGFTSRVLKPEPSSKIRRTTTAPASAPGAVGDEAGGPTAARGEIGVSTYLPRWQKEPEPRQSVVQSLTARRIVVIGPFPHMESCHYDLRVIEADGDSVAERYEQCALALAEEVKGLQQQTTHVLLQVIVPIEEDSDWFSGLSGLLNSASQETSNLRVQLVATDGSIDIDNILRAEAGDPRPVRYICGLRQVNTLVPADLPAVPANGDDPLWREGAVYVLSGGLGGLGRLLIEDMTGHVERCTVVALGRRLPTAEQHDFIDRMAEKGITVEPITVDVADTVAVAEQLAYARQRFGPIRGVVHAAGQVEDNMLASKSQKEIRGVLAAKVRGVEAMDLATQSDGLDFFIAYSSAAVLGNMGQADYACANGFLDSYIRNRAALVTEGSRSGKSVSINWPLWEQGGMQVDAEFRQLMRHRTGSVPLPNAVGMDTLHRILLHQHPQVLVFYGEGDRFARVLEHKPDAPSPTTPSDYPQRDLPFQTEATKLPPSAAAALLKKVEALLLEVAAETIRLAPGELDLVTELGDFGFDSISITRMSNKLNDEYGLDVMPTFFFEAANFANAASELVELFPSQLAEKLNVKVRDVEPAPDPVPEAEPVVSDPSGGVASPASDDASSPQTETEDDVFGAELRRAGRPTSPDEDAVAVIGVAGRFPGAKDIDEFWSNLVSGIDSITEVPGSRWDWRVINGDPCEEEGKTNVRWGGFIDGVDEFDAGFFNIMPSDAELLDPQHRLLMTYVWQALEDAGCSAESLAGTDLALFVATATDMGYDELMDLDAYRSGRPVVRVPGCTGVNRMSYLLDVHGPSETVETTCSSSLVAVHRGVQTILEGRSDQAVVGGVQTIVSPTKHIRFSKLGILSPEGRCKTFSQQADGFVRGEGVGMVVLKRLSLAKRDNDQIYGVIRASGVNHGGKAKDFSSPNAKAQARLIESVLASSRIDPRQVNVIETHGTGTKLGDPIEINGLKSAFANAMEAMCDGSPDVVSDGCGLASVKSNVGHLELAAGVAGLIKLLLQMKHRTLVKTLHCDEVNPMIRLDGSPFHILQSNRPWEPARDSAGQALTRVGSVSSFGFNGVNAHAVVEEYVPPTAVPAGPGTALPFVLSARTPDQLNARLADLRQYLLRYPDTSLPDVAFTLCAGRSAMAHRFACTATTTDELIERLGAYLERGAEASCWIGSSDQAKTVLPLLGSAVDVATSIERWIAEGDYERLLHAWAVGLSVDWLPLFAELPVVKISLPGYPFRNDRHWIELPDGMERPLDVRVDRSASVSSTVPTTRVGAMPVIQATEDAEQKGADILAFTEHWIPSERVRSPQHLTDDDVLFIAAEDFEAVRGSGSVGDAVVVPSARRKQANIESSETLFDFYRDELSSVLAKSGELGTVIYLGAMSGPENRVDHVHVKALFSALHSLKVTARSVLLSGRFGDPLERCFLDAWVGYARSLARNSDAGRVQIVIGDWGNEDSRLSDLCMENGVSDDAVMFESGARYVPRLEELTDLSQQSNELPFEQGGTYLITGGGGQLGLAVARFLAEGLPCKLALLGRSGVDDQVIAELRGLGADVLVVRADVADEVDMRRAVFEITSTLGEIRGVFHAAGITSAEPIVDRSNEAFLKTLSTKIDGTVLLDEVLRHQPLDFVCYFSSTAGVLGDFGSCDYSIANRFLQAYAKFRESDAVDHRTLAVSWPLWKDGGMRFDSEEGAQLYLQASGQQPLERIEGLNVLLGVLQRPSTHTVFFKGVRSKLLAMLGMGPAVSPPEPAISASNDAVASPRATIVSAVGKLRQMVREVTKLPIEELGVDTNFAELGFESVALVQLARAIERSFGCEFNPTLFYSYPTIGKVAGYLEDARDLEPVGDPGAVAEVVDKTPAEIATSPDGQTGHRGPGGAERDIAIIGMSGRFPQARDMDEFWEILRTGRCVVEEVPRDRLALSALAEEDLDQQVWRWLGWAPGVMEFDPLFFEMSPREARETDPRQRLMLQEAWSAMEKAGLLGSGVDRSRIGLFSGIEQGDFARLMGEWATITGANDAILASRLAYLLDISGPVLATNTACSSGLVALHQACLSLQARECDFAVVCAVNLILDVNTLRGLGAAGMLSPNGRCYAFDERADGMVPGEAAVAVVLSRLDTAENDRRPIQGVIAASGINYDGKTNGITAPSGKAQVQLLRNVYRIHDIDVNSIDYLVAHGTGTSLGDPIEINALAETFADRTAAMPMAVTSAKANFGHTFSASGLLSLVNVLAAMEHELIPISPLCEQQNKLIVQGEAPFVVNREIRSWPVGPRPRYAAVSAFGMSGTNAHVVVKSYASRPAQDGIHDDDGAGSQMQLVVLSARTPDALQQQLDKLAHWLDANPGAAVADVSFTLARGRQHLSHRVYLIADSVESLAAQCSSRAESGSFSEVSRAFLEAQGEVARLDSLARHHRDDFSSLELIGQAFLEGYDLPSDLWQPACRYLQLPTYPFSRVEYWPSAHTEVQQPDTLPDIGFRVSDVTDLDLNVEAMLEALPD